MRKIDFADRHQTINKDNGSYILLKSNTKGLFLCAQIRWFLEIFVPLQPEMAYCVLL